MRSAKLEAGVETIQARFDSAQLTANEARRIEKARQDAISDIATAGTAQEGLVASIREGGPQLEGAQERVKSADAAVAEARRVREAAAILADERQACLSQLRDMADLASLLKRSERAKAAIAALQGAASDAAIPVDTALLASIRDQHRTVELARARLEASRPLVRLVAFADLTGVVDGLEVKLPTGTGLERRVDQSLELTLPDVASLSVAVGATGDMTSTELEAAEVQLKDLLRAAGASDLADAERRHKLREDAARTMNEQRRVLGENLGDLTQDALEERIAALRGRTKTTKAARAGARSADEDEVRRSVEEAQRELAATEQLVRVAELEWQAAHAHLAEIEVARSERNTELRLATEDLDRREAALAAERATASDESVARSLRTAEGAEEALHAEFEAARTELAREGPDQARELLANATQALARVDAETRQVQDELLEVTTRLRDHGEDGLAEDLQDAVADKDQAELRAASLPGPRGGPEAALRDDADGTRSGPESVRRAAPAGDREPRQDRVRHRLLRGPRRPGPLGRQSYAQRSHHPVQQPEHRRPGADRADLEARLRDDRGSRRRCPRHPRRCTRQLGSAAPRGDGGRPGRRRSPEPDHRAHLPAGSLRARRGRSDRAAILIDGDRDEESTGGEVVRGSSGLRVESAAQGLAMAANSDARLVLLAGRSPQVLRQAADAAAEQLGWRTINGTTTSLQPARIDLRRRIRWSGRVEGHAEFGTLDAPGTLPTGVMIRGWSVATTVRPPPRTRRSTRRMDPSRVVSRLRANAASARHVGRVTSREIMYGLPLMDDVWRQKLDGGEWSIGGCMIMPNAPDRECNTCHRQFRQDGSDPYGAQGGNWG